jgi:hypothetical protein
VRAYHCTGPAYILPPGAVEDLLSYVYTLPWSILSRYNEDIIASMWAYGRQKPFWYSLPAPLTHDTAVPSTLGYDNHPNRVPIAFGGPYPDPTIRDRLQVPFAELSWLPTAKLDHVRRALRDGFHICPLCTARKGVVGLEREGIMLCQPCINEVYGVALRGPR